MSIAPGFVTGQYYPSDSLVHRVDPRVKLLLVVIFTLAVFFVKNFTGFGITAILIGLLIYLSKLPVTLTLKGVRPLLFILALTLLVHLMEGGGSWIGIGPIHISETGLRNGTFVDLRLILLIIGASFLTLTSTPVELTGAIESILSPLRKVGVPSHELAMMMTIALRFIPTLSFETDKLIKAQTARGARFDSRNPITRAKSFIPILVPLFVNVFRRADELAEAMEARAYRGGEGRTRMNNLKMKQDDWLGLITMGLLIAGTVWIGRLPII